MSLNIKTHPTGYSSWEGRNGVINNYWSGTRNASDTGCQCSLDGTCAKTLNNDPVCNCDSIGANLIDDGNLTDKDSLPVKSLKYGASVTPYSSVKYVLGPLVCSGKGRVLKLKTQLYLCKINYV